MELIDTHCHLTSLDDSSLVQILARANASGVTRFICIGASDGVKSAKQAIELAERYQSVWATVGIHPHDATNYTNVREIEALVSHPRVVAIGETGLDFYRQWAPFDNQRRLFESSVALAKNSRKPLIIHCRDALEETYQTLVTLDAKTVGGVFHCYSGDEEFAKNLRDINFLVSIAGNLTFKKAQALQTAASLMPLEQIMLETDCPYLAPEPYRGEPSEPKHVLQTAKKLAELRNVTLEEVAASTTRTALRFFGLGRGSNGA